MRPWPRVVLAVTLLSACADPPTTLADAAAPDAATPDAARPDASRPDAGEMPDAGTSSCALITIEQLEFDSLDDVSIRYRGQIEPALGQPFRDVLVFDVMRRADFPTSTGTFSLGPGFNGNFATCTHCFLIFEDVLPNDVATRVYFQRAGELTLTADPFDFRLTAQIRGLELVEVTIGGEFLESIPVPGGRCAHVEDLTVDYRYVPDEWTCAHELFDDGQQCDCGCGAADFDCYPGIDRTVGCAANEACVNDACVVRCSAFEPLQPCAEGFCSFSEWGDLCSTDRRRVDPAPLGGTCTIEDPFYCAMENGIPRGICDTFGRADNICKRTCRSDDDCNAGDRQSCLTAWPDRGFCEQRFPPGWTCGRDQYEEGRTCDCNCGVPDTVDCQSELPLAGCARGQGCTLEGRCVAAPLNDRCADARLITATSTTVVGTVIGAADDLTVGPGAGRCLEGDQQGPDVFYQVRLDAGQALELTLRPDGYDGALYVLGPGSAVESCADAVARCGVGSDSGGNGEAEQLGFVAPSAGTYTVVVDSFWINAQGRFALDVSVR